MTSASTVVQVVFQGNASGLNQAAGQGAAALNNVTKAVKQAQDPMRLLAPQITDIVVSLASGQKPFTVFLQQGGQMKDMFGGLAPLGRALATVFTAQRIAMGGAAAAAFALYSAWSEGYEQSKRFRDAIALTGDAAGLTEGRFNALAERVSVATGSTISDTREMAMSLVETGRMGSAAIEAVSAAALRVAKVSGKSTEEVNGDFAGMADGVAKWADKHNRSWHFATADQLAYIEKLEKTKGAQVAMVETGNLITKHLDGQRTQLGYLERAWASITSKASAAWGAMMGLGRTETPEDQIKSVTAQIEALQTRRSNNPEQTAQRLEALQRRLHDLQIASAEAASRAGNRSAFDQEQDAKRQKQIKDAQDAERNKKTPEQLQREYERMVRETLSNRAPRLADIEAAGYEAANRAAVENMAAQAEALRKRNEDAATLGQQLREQTEQVNVSLITDARARGEAEIEIERKTWQARIDMLAKGGADVTAAQQALDESVLASRRALDEQLKPAWQRMLDDYSDTTRQMKEGWDAMAADMISAGEDVWAKFATTGKLSVKGLVSMLLEEFARLQYRQLLGQMAGGSDLSSLIGQGIGSLIGAFSGGYNYSGNASAGLSGAQYSLLHSAKGNAFSGGTGLSAYRNTVVDRPTVFAFAKGAGLMGEAGPEAIMPLRRDASGRLGVAAAGHGAQEVTVNNYMGDQAQATVTEDNGRLIIDFERRVLATVSGDMAAGGATARATAGRFGQNNGATLRRRRG